MRLIFEHFDGRGWNYKDVIDQDTGNKVGYVKSHGVGFGNVGGIDVSLFDDKYRRTLNNYLCEGRGGRPESCDGGSRFRCV